LIDIGWMAAWALPVVASEQMVMDDDRQTTCETWERPADETHILSSRAKVYEDLRQAWLNRNLGLRMLTGESGIGKTFLWRKAAESVKLEHHRMRWIALSILPRNTSLGLLHAIQIALEENPFRAQMTPEQLLARIEARFLAIHQDGYRAEIVVEESHHLSKEGFETLRIIRDRLLYHRLNAGVLLVGQSPLRNRFGRFSRLWRPAGWHLSHISAGETLDLLRQINERNAWTKAEADWIHREALGNPGRIVRWTETFTPLPAESSDPKDKPLLKPGYAGASYSTGYEKTLNEPLLPVKPPLEESDGLIEVGYDDAENELTAEIDESYASTNQEQGRPVGIYGREPGSKIWFDGASPFSPLGLNQVQREEFRDIETEM
jgi:AAA domain